MDDVFVANSSRGSKRTRGTSRARGRGALGPAKMGLIVMSSCVGWLPAPDDYFGITPKYGLLTVECHGLIQSGPYCPFEYNPYPSGLNFPKLSPFYQKQAKLEPSVSLNIGSAKKKRDRGSSLPSKKPRYLEEIGLTLWSALYSPSITPVGSETSEEDSTELEDPYSSSDTSLSSRDVSSADASQGSERESTSFSTRPSSHTSSDSSFFGYWSFSSVSSRDTFSEDDLVEWYFT
ncbi:hypothetical protein PIB30_028114, partial [Stylosanthes scabra]|nr:hypothetical protein [Stylosanthes scabra]